MPAIGYLQVHVFTSSAQIPLQDVAIAIVDSSGTVIAYRLTDRNGQLQNPIEIIVPNLESSTSPNTSITPYTSANIYARKEDYEEIYVKNVQIFAQTVTEQPLQMIPLAEFPGQWNKGEEFVTTPQNL